MSASAPRTRSEARRATRFSVWTSAAVALSLLVVLVAPPSSLLERDVPRTLWLLSRATVLLLLPGAALWLLLGGSTTEDVLQRVCLWPILTLALLPILLLWVTIAGARLDSSGVRGLLVCASVLIVWRQSALRSGARAGPTDATRAGRAAFVSHDRFPTAGGYVLALALVAIVAVSLGVRLYLIRGVPYPAWVDSYHHTIITQIMLDTGRVPTSYAPFADIPSFLYHFGYHAYSAFLSWVTGLPAHRAVLWGGQVLNCLSVASVFYAVDRLARDHRAALIAGLVVGLLSRMPAYYVNWGRYPQLAGQVVLPVAVALTVDACRSPSWSWGRMLLAGVATAGLALTHYRVLVFFLVAGIVFAGTHTACHANWPKRAARLWPRLVVVGLVAGALVSPWLPPLIRKTAVTAQQTYALTGGTQYDYITLDFVLGYGLPAGLLATALLSAVWTLVRVRRVPLGALTLLWLAGVAFLANPLVSGTPSGFLTNGTLIVALYLPAALLIGLAIGDAWKLLGMAASRCGRWAGYAVNAVLVMVLCAGGVWGALDMSRHGLEPSRYLVSNEDLAAMGWVREHTPADAVFAVGATFWLSTAVTGNDAGYWLPYVAGRKTLVPPMVYINEGDATYVARANHAVKTLAQATTSSDLVDALRREGATHIYLARQHEQPWQAALMDAERFELLYDAGGVRVYRVR